MRVISTTEPIASIKYAGPTKERGGCSYRVYQDSYPTKPCGGRFGNYLSRKGGSGVTYYEVPPEYGPLDYRYAVVNGRTVLVDTRTNRIVDIVD